MAGSDLVTDYKSLLPLSNLRGLVIIDSLTDLETLINLKQLRYLSVEKRPRDSNIITTLSKALPGCVVVPNSGACLGSGWLMLVLPLAFCCLQLFCHLQQRENSMKASILNIPFRNARACIPKKRNVIKEVLLCGTSLVLFAYLVEYSFPVKYAAFIPLIFVAAVIGNRININTEALQQIPRNIFRRELYTLYSCNANRHHWRFGLPR